MPAAIVHFTNEFVSGLIYVAISRAASADHIQVLNFKPEQLLKPPPEVLEQCSTDLSLQSQDLSYCRHREIETPDFFTVKEARVTEVQDEDLLFPTEQADETISSYFEVTGGPKDPVELNVLYEQLSAS